MSGFICPHCGELVDIFKSGGGEELAKQKGIPFLGKLPIDGYAQLLANSAVGVSLMVSPHPSYPPLEMAAFGCRVVTNRFANKDLSTLSPRILSVDRLDPPSIADAIARACALAESEGLAGERPKELGDFLGDDDRFSFAGRLAAELKGQSA